MAGVNKVILIGHLGKDPEVRHLESGRSVASFSLATSETYKNKAGERVTATEWHQISIWSPLAEIAEKYLKKGSQVYIEGRLTTRSYEDKEGVKKYVTEVVGQSFTMLDRKPGDGGTDSSGSGSYAKESVEQTVPGGENDIDDLPF